MYISFPQSWVYRLPEHVFFIKHILWTVWAIFVVWLWYVHVFVFMYECTVQLSEGNIRCLPQSFFWDKVSHWTLKSPNGWTSQPKTSGISLSIYPPKTEVKRCLPPAPAFPGVLGMNSGPAWATDNLSTGKSPWLQVQHFEYGWMDWKDKPRHYSSSKFL